MTAQHPVGVRQHLARVTRDIHEALHNDPVLSVLSAPTLTPATYRAALQVFSVFYQSVERKRVALACCDDFALQDECSALSRDLGGCAPDAPDLSLSNGMQLLGALYVAHGASFGRGTFRANVTRRLPDHSHTFVGLRTDARRWQTLVATLEDAGQDATNLRHIQTGATRAFAYVDRAARGMNVPDRPETAVVA
ncbi:MAG: hypothetical protein AAFU86_08525 [Pseudomonadota bacterium]